MPTDTKYEQLFEQRHSSITRAVGPITPAVIDKLQDEVAVGFYNRFRYVCDGSRTWN